MTNETIITNKPALVTRVTQLGSCIGSTPVHTVQHLFRKREVAVYAKKEWMQLSGSIKARAAYYIIRNAITTGNLTEKKVLLDATSGNTGIAYATIARELGLRVELCLPENASSERKKILQSLGAKITFTSRFEGTDGAQQVAAELARKYPGRYFYADQYKNENNPQAHYMGTAPEIFEAHPDITHFVAGLGTTGTFTGTGKRLKELNPAVQLIALQPDSAMHALEGWKHLETAIVPAIYNDHLADAFLEVSTTEAYETIRSAYRHEGLLLSPSAAANLAGAIKVAHTLTKGVVVTVLPDNDEKYKEITHQLLQ
jgi:cysteine synthase B